MATHSPTGMEFGTAVHELFEQVTWIDETFPFLPDSDAGDAVRRIIQNPALKEIFEKGDRAIDLFREQATDVILDGKFISGVIDRLHVHRTPEGAVTRVDIIDFKTDAVKEPAELAIRYTSQMQAYRQTIQKIHPEAAVHCSLLSVKHGSLIAV